ncbi:MAG: hypothetical protein OXG43_06330 [Chloroflexi bacterium]|nr:hypothetical protein [Chloroflexota bacterium]
MDDAAECPLAQTDDKFDEAHYFVSRMMDEYHDPMPFRYNLNAFLQALRNVTFVLQKEFAHRDGFSSWYQKKQEAMRNDSLLRNFLEGRNVVVKQGSLELNSNATVGVFRSRTIKLGIGGDVPASLSSDYIIQQMALKSGLIPPEHFAIDEQYGVRREWYAPELGQGNVLTLCDLAWVKIGRVLSEAHEIAGWHSMPPVEHGHKAEKCDVLLEMDIDPILPEKWGWYD